MGASVALPLVAALVGLLLRCVAVQSRAIVPPTYIACLSVPKYENAAAAFAREDAEARAAHHSRPQPTYSTAVATFSGPRRPSGVPLMSPAFASAAVRPRTARPAANDVRRTAASFGASTCDLGEADALPPPRHAQPFTRLSSQLFQRKDLTRRPLLRGWGCGQPAVGCPRRRRPFETPKG